MFAENWNQTKLNQNIKFGLVMDGSVNKIPNPEIQTNRLVSFKQTKWSPYNII